jgi:hypothetical protein
MKVQSSKLQEISFWEIQRKWIAKSFTKISCLMSGIKQWVEKWPESWLKNKHRKWFLSAYCRYRSDNSRNQWRDSRMRSSKCVGWLSLSLNAWARTFPSPNLTSNPIIHRPYSSSCKIRLLYFTVHAPNLKEWPQWNGGRSVGNGQLNSKLINVCKHWRRLNSCPQQWVHPIL